MIQYNNQHKEVRKEVVAKCVFLILLLLSFFGLMFFPLTTSNWDFVLFPILVFISIPFLNYKTLYSKIVLFYTLLVFLSCLYSHYYNYQALHLVTIHSYKYFALLFFFYLFHNNITTAEAERIFIIISIICCCCYIVQWLIYPTVWFSGAADESMANTERYRVRIPGSLSCYCLLLYGINTFILLKRFKYLLYSVLGFIPIIIMGFRTLSLLSVVSVFLIIPFITRRFGKTLIYSILASVLLVLSLQTDLVKSKIDEMLQRTEVGQTFDNEDYIRYLEFDYYWNDFFNKPGEKVFGGGVPVDVSTQYRRDVYFNNFAFSDLGLIGLGLIIGFPAVVLLVLCYLLCIWKLKEPRLQYLRFTLFVVLLGSLITTSELYRTGNILLFSIILYIELQNSKEKKQLVQ